MGDTPLFRTGAGRHSYRPGRRGGNGQYHDWAQIFGVPRREERGIYPVHNLNIWYKRHVLEKRDHNPGQGWDLHSSGFCVTVAKPLGQARFGQKGNHPSVSTSNRKGMSGVESRSTELALVGPPLEATDSRLALRPARLKLLHS